MHDTRGCTILSVQPLSRCTLTLRRCAVMALKWSTQRQGDEGNRRGSSTLGAWGLGPRAYVLLEGEDGAMDLPLYDLDKQAWESDILRRSIGTGDVPSHRHGGTVTFIQGLEEVYWFGGSVKPADISVGKLTQAAHVTSGSSLPMMTWRTIPAPTLEELAATAAQAAAIAAGTSKGGARDRRSSMRPVPKDGKPKKGDGKDAEVPSEPVLAEGSWPRPRSGHAAAAVQRSGDWCVAISGGYESGGSLLLANDGLWLFNTVKQTWLQITDASGISPLPRRDHTLCSVGNGSALIAFGGCTMTGLSNDLFVFDMKTSRWSLASHPDGNGGPCPRAWHTAVTARSEHIFTSSPDGAGDMLWTDGEKDEGVLVYGGAAPYGLADAALWSLHRSGAWRRHDIRGPSPRYGHTAILYDGQTRLAVFGGADGSGGKRSDWHVMDLLVREVERVPTPPPDPRVMAKRFDNDDMYEGENVGGLRAGKGTCVYADGSRYEGEWLQDMRHGVGELQLANGDMYVGSFAFGMFDGQGRYKVFSPPSPRLTSSKRADAKLMQYDGGWVKGQRHGQGTATFSDGSEYTGAWTNNLRDGNGSLTYDGVKVEGYWEQGQLKSGKEVRPNTEVYEGEFMGRWRHGRGKVTYVDGSEFDGFWRFSKRNGHGSYFNAKTQERHEGKWVADARNGRGRSVYGSGARYEGTWKDGERDGMGILEYTNGDVYNGQFRHDKQDGTGVLTRKGGVIVDGKWSDGVQVA